MLNHKILLGAKLLLEVGRINILLVNVTEWYR